MTGNVQRWIDPHVHLFALREGRYDWLKPQNPPFWSDKAEIAKDISEHDLAAGCGNRLAGFVHVEAGYDNQRPWREIEFLQRHCRYPFRAVGCIDINANTAGSHIDKLSSYHSVSGLRHILDEGAHAILSSPKAKWSLGYMAQHGLTFEVQCDMTDSKAINALLRILVRHPQLKIAVNHSAIAPLETNSLAYKTWKQNIMALNETGQVVFKFSGLEMQNRQWCWHRATLLLTTLINLVDIHTLMLASNYPLSNWRMPYTELWHGYKKITTPLSQREKAALFIDNAKHWYRFD